MNEPLKDTSELSQDMIGPGVKLFTERTKVKVRVPGFPNARLVRLNFHPRDNVLEVEVTV